MKVYRSKAPLRLGLAGGGTDVSPYCELYCGAILNATISLYANASIEITGQPHIMFSSADLQISETFDFSQEIDLNGPLVLLKGVYNRINRDYGIPKIGFKLTTKVDAPAGSGLGSSSTLVVAIIGVFMEYLKIPMGEYDVAKYAYDIERNDLSLLGGKQDQYAATFGGFNFMEFMADDKVIVNPLRIKSEYIAELSHNLLLYFSSVSRSSADIIEEQQKNVKIKNEASIEAMHHLKEQALQMKEALLLGQLSEIGHILDFGFEQKIKMAKNITNEYLNEIYSSAKAAGASGGKISGAGGGGFLFFYCPGVSKHNVVNALSKFSGTFASFQFEERGLITWSIDC
jgi:D-glycero-alpha-D-manno-heptose-7-phosphate kinase